ncbi:MAG: TonB-dependent receptor, partial [Gammaproteobacteria bacterium]|nr:TonB-dependent receptor [Gammaproteobacteria bacterium]
FSGSVVGDSSDWFELPGGPVGFAAGVEYREESSDARFDPWQRGVIPAGSPHPAGTLISDVSNNGSLGFDPSILIKNEYGEYDATDAFLELSLPLLANTPGFRELTLDVAGRLSNYSTVGDTESWKLNLVWAPIEDIAFRGSVSQAVRAPNITELFGPEVGATARPVDPCDIVNITALSEADATKGANTQANCVADFQSFGLDPFDANGNYVWTDPLSARFTGVSSGNRNLMEETADTQTYGFVFTPSFFPGFSLTVDVWDISIDDGISSVTVQDIVDGCYQGASLNEAFCALIGRNTDVNSAQAGGFNFFRTTDINFAIIEADGIDLSASYNFDIGEHGFRASVTATEMGKLDFYTNPLDLTEVNPELGEISRPEHTGNVYLGWTWGDLSVGWQSQYLGEMLLGTPRAEIETYETLFGPTLLQGETWIHDLNARYVVNDELTVYGGINNVTQTNPFISENAFPATPRGRVIFLGGTYRL